MEDGFVFLSLKDQIVVSVGFDKSDTDFVGTMHPCNRYKGNASINVQSFAVLEGPVAENYENEVLTIGNDIYPIKKTIQSLVDDNLYALSLLTCDGQMIQKCLCFVFDLSQWLHHVLFAQSHVFYHLTHCVRPQLHGVL